MQTSKTKYHFNKITDTNILSHLKAEWQKSLVAPQDDMWESFTDSATHWEISHKDKIIGYACVNDENCLLQFFVLPICMPKGVSILKQFIDHQNIASAMIGTNNPMSLSIAMHIQKSVKVHTYLFTDILKTETDKVDGTFRVVESQELETIVDFYHESIGAPKGWLNGYLGNLVEKSEVFVLTNGDKILGACEIRKSESNPKVAGVGMVVSSEHRKKGIGTFLLGKAKEKAIAWNRLPICSCEKDNVGSLKSIERNGFRSMHQMLLITF